MSPMAQSLLMVKPAAFNLPYVLDWDGDLPYYQSLGFAFTGGIGRQSLYSDGDNLASPAGANSDLLWSASPISGSPSPSGGNYVWLSGVGGSTDTITLPAGLVASKVSYWATGYSSPGGDIQIRLRYSNATTSTVFSSPGNPGPGFIAFSQFYLQPVSPPGTQITHVDIILPTNFARFAIDDLAFHP